MAKNSACLKALSGCLAPNTGVELAIATGLVGAWQVAGILTEPGKIAAECSIWPTCRLNWAEDVDGWRHGVVCSW